MRRFRFLLLSLFNIMRMIFRFLWIDLSIMIVAKFKVSNSWQICYIAIKSNTFKTINSTLVRTQVNFVLYICFGRDDKQPIDRNENLYVIVWNVNNPSGAASISIRGLIWIFLTKKKLPYHFLMQMIMLIYVFHFGDMIHYICLSTMFYRKYQFTQNTKTFFTSSAFFKKKILIINL